MKTIERQYTREYFTVKETNRKLSYLFSKGISNKLILCLPQGRRPAQFFIETYKIIPVELNVIVVDMPNRGESDRFKAQSKIEPLAQIVKELVLYKNFNIVDTIIFGKSITSHIAAEIVANDKFLSAIIVAGPRMMSIRQAKFTKFILTIITKLQLTYLHTKLFYLYILIRELLKPKQAPVYDPSDYDQWYLTLSIAEKRLKPVRPSKTPTLFIENQHDELASESNLKEVYSGFENKKITKLHTKSHWGPVTKEELEIIQNYLYKLLF